MSSFERVRPADIDGEPVEIVEALPPVDDVELPEAAHADSSEADLPIPTADQGAIDVRPPQPAENEHSSTVPASSNSSQRTPKIARVAVRPRQPDSPPTPAPKSSTERDAALPTDNEAPPIPPETSTPEPTRASDDKVPLVTPEPEDIETVAAPSASDNVQETPEHDPEQASGKITFVLTEHTVSSAEKIANELKDCDVLVFEAHGLTSPERLEAEQDRTDYISSRWEEIKQTPDGQDLAGSIAQAQEQEVDYTLAVLRHFQGTDKPVKLIDTPNSHSVQPLLDGEKELRGIFYDSLNSHLDNNLLRMLVGEQITMGAESSFIRDRVMQGQVRAIQKEHPGAHLGVIMGAAHEGVSTAMGEEAETEVRITHPQITDDEAAPQSSRLSCFSQALVQKQETGAVEPQLLERALLEAHLSAYLLQISDVARDVEQGLTVIEDAVQSMPYEDAAAMLDELDAIKAQRQPGGKNAEIVESQLVSYAADFLRRHHAAES